MKRILIISTRPIDTVLGGDVLRIVSIKKYLSKFYDVDFICITYCFISTKSIVKKGNVTYIQLTYWQIFKNITRSIFTLQSLQKNFYFNHDLIRYVDGCALDYEKIILHLSRLHFLSAVLRKNNCNTIMELTDALSFMYRDAVKLGNYISIKALVYRYENIFYPKFEKEVCNSYQAVVVCGYLDYQKLSKLGKNLHHFGNGVELPKLDDRTIASKDSVIFVGNLRTLQNQEGIKNFYKHCYKNNLAPHGIKLKIVGFCPQSMRAYFKDKKNVEVLGFVEDLQTVMVESFCGVNPVEIGAGIQNKNLLIASYAVPVVAIMSSLKRVEFDDCFIGCEDLDEMAEKIIYLFENRSQAKKLGKKGRNYVEQHCSWDRALSGYESV